MQRVLIKTFIGGLCLALVGSLSASVASASPTTPVSTIKSGTKKLVYTFDDGPHPTRTDTVLDALKAHGVPATFFINGANIKGKERVLLRAAAEGHIIGSHQWDHIDVKDATKPLVFRDQIVRNRDAIKGLVGDKQPLYFRYPYGARAPWKDQILREEGYADAGVGWHIDTLDWAFAATGTAKHPDVPANLKSDYQGYVMWHANKVGGGIVLHHDIKLITGNRLDQELTAMKAAGYSFENLPQ